VVLKRESVSDSVEKLLMDRIATGVYRVGERLPTEREFAESLGVSRTGIREALNRLQRVGLISTVRGLGGGSFVQEPDSAFLTDALSLMLKMKGITKDELIEARLVLAPAVAALAAQRLTPEELDGLEVLWDSMGEPGLSDEHTKVFSFHVRLAEACGNTILRASMMPLLNLVEPVVDLATRTGQSGARELRPLLYDVLVAVRNRDSEAARGAMRTYMDRFGEYLTSLEVQPPWMTSGGRSGQANRTGGHERREGKTN
jgi:DNA-binding FadR family transcriptional regulator